MAQIPSTTIDKTAFTHDNHVDLTNQMKSAVLSGHSGATRPPDIKAGGQWVRTHKTGDKNANGNDISGHTDLMMFDGTKDIQLGYSFVWNATAVDPNDPNGVALLPPETVYRPMNSPVALYLEPTDDAFPGTTAANTLTLERYLNAKNPNYLPINGDTIYDAWMGCTWLRRGDPSDGWWSAKTEGMQGEFAIGNVPRKQNFMTGAWSSPPYNGYANAIAPGGTTEPLCFFKDVTSDYGGANPIGYTIYHTGDYTLLIGDDQKREKYAAYSGDPTRGPNYTAGNSVVEGYTAYFTTSWYPYSANAGAGESTINPPGMLRTPVTIKVKGQNWQTTSTDPYDVANRTNCILVGADPRLIDHSKPNTLTEIYLKCPPKGMTYRITKTHYESMLTGPFWPVIPTELPGYVSGTSIASDRFHYYYFEAISQMPLTDNDVFKFTITNGNVVQNSTFHNGELSAFLTGLSIDSTDKGKLTVSVNHAELPTGAKVSYRIVDGSPSLAITGESTVGASGTTFYVADLAKAPGSVDLSTGTYTFEIIAE